MVLWFKLIDIYILIGKAMKGYRLTKYWEKTQENILISIFVETDVSSLLLILCKQLYFLCIEVRKRDVNLERGAFHNSHAV
jgi:hypothetical protein